MDRKNTLNIKLDKPKATSAPDCKKLTWVTPIVTSTFVEKTHGGSSQTQEDDLGSGVIS